MFSRLFVVDLFFPAFFTGAALDKLSPGAFLPKAYADQPATRLLIIGGISVLAGLALSALQQSLMNIFAGPLPPFAALTRRLMYRWGRIDI